MPSRAATTPPTPAWGPWGVQLAGSFSEGDVLARFERVRRRYEAVLGDYLPLVVPGRLTDASTYVVRVSAKSRADADALCARLRAAGVRPAARHPRHGRGSRSGPWTEPGCRSRR